MVVFCLQCMIYVCHFYPKMPGLRMWTLKARGIVAFGLYIRLNVFASLNLLQIDSSTLAYSFNTYYQIYEHISVFGTIVLGCHWAHAVLTDTSVIDVTRHVRMKSVFCLLEKIFQYLPQGGDCHLKWNRQTKIVIIPGVIYNVKAYLL